MKTEDIKTWGDRLAEYEDGAIITSHHVQKEMQAEIEELRAALAERERILKIAYTQSTMYGLTGESMWIGIKAHTRNGEGS